MDVTAPGATDLGAADVSSRLSEPLAFFRLEKVNEQTGEFTAVCANESVDTAREICDVVQSLPHFDALEKRCLEESGGKKVAPLRRMHGLHAAGNVVEFQKDASGKRVAMLGKITNPEDLNMVLEGTLCGVSMGGKKKYTGFDAITGARRYIAMPEEISLVDLGAIPGTGITMLNALGGFTVEQADGSTEQRLFKSYAETLPAGEGPGSIAHLIDTADHHVRHAEKHALSAVETVKKIAEVLPVVSPEAGRALADVRGKHPMQNAARTDEPNPKEGEHKYGDVAFADEENKKYPIDSEKHIRAAWNYINKEKNAAKYKDHGRAVRRKIIAAWKSHIDKAGPPSAKMDKAALAELAKNTGFYLAASIVNIVGELSYLSELQKEEEIKEGDENATALCAQLDAAIRALGDCAMAMLDEELGELPEEAGDDAGDGDEPMANAVDGLRGLKGRMQRMHNMSVEMGAACVKADAPPTEMTDCNKATQTSALTPTAEEDGDMTDEAMQKAVGDAIAKAMDGDESPMVKAIGAAMTAVITPKLEAMEKATGERLTALEGRIETVEKTPVPTGGILNPATLLEAMKKATDGEAELDELVKKDPVAAAKFIQQQTGRTLTHHGFVPIPSA